MLNDSDYLESVDITPYTSTLISQLITARPEKTAAFCKEYFDRLSSSQHVIGQSYATITQCRWNRRSFVKCCRESFENFDPDELMSTFDHAILIRALCPNIATALLHEVHFLITEVGHEQSRSYPLKLLNTGLFFIILFEEWMHEMKMAFGETSKIKDGNDTLNTNTTKYLKLSEIEATIKRIRLQYEPFMDIPNKLSLDAVMERARTTFGDDSDLSYDTFRRLCVSNERFRDNIYGLIPPPSNIQYNRKDNSRK